MIFACALEQDMLQWPHADQTYVGENGVGLSGGQKSRITLARATYRYYASSALSLEFMPLLFKISKIIKIKGWGRSTI